MDHIDEDLKSGDNDNLYCLSKPDFLHNNLFTVDNLYPADSTIVYCSKDSSPTDTSLNNESISVEHVKQENMSEENINGVLSDNKLELDLQAIEIIKMEDNKHEKYGQTRVASDDKLELAKESQEEVYRCSTCSYQTRNMYQLGKHEVVHLAPEERQLFACVHCDKKYKTRCGLDYHLESNHIDFRVKESEKKIYSCSTCIYQTRIMAHLKNHEKVHMAQEERQLFACVHCSKKYMTKYGLDYHLDVNHMDFRAKEAQKKVYKCTICDYETPHKLNLNKHKVVHLAPEERHLFACAHCGKKYVQKSTLECHLKRYHIDSRRHKKVHLAPEEPQLFGCADCDKKYKSKRSLRHHLKHNHINYRAKELIELQKKVYRCSTCSYQTQCGSSFSTHMNIHLTPEERQWFRCAHCDKKYLQKYRLQCHLKRHHNDSRNAHCISLTDEVILDSLKIEIDDHTSLLDDSKNSESVANEVKSEELQIEPDEVPLILNKDTHNDFKNTENLSVTRKVKLEDFIKMEPDDDSLDDTFLDEGVFRRKKHS